MRVHDLDVPRIGYVHAWQRTQDEGWVRAALDTYGVPYTYFGDIKLREGNLRQKYDVIIFPHVGGNAESQVNGIAKGPGAPLPYKKSAETPNLGGIDEADDIRGGMGWEGLMELRKFVEQGGTLLTEGLDHADLPRVQVHDRRHGGGAGRPVRPRLGDARDRLGSHQPDRVWLRRAGAGLLQPVAGAERRWRGRRWWRRSRRRRDPRRRDERDADGQSAERAVAVRCGGGGAGTRRCAGRARWPRR